MDPDHIHIKKDGSVDIYLQANLVVTPPSGGMATNAELTTIYGKQAPGSTLTGFDPTDGISFDSLEQQIGSSGQVFSSFAHETVAARDLSSHLAGVDLSGASQRLRPEASKAGAMRLQELDFCRR